MSQTVAAAGNGQSFLDELQAAAAVESAASLDSDLHPRGTVETGEERSPFQFGPDGPHPAPPGPPPPPPDGVGPDGRFGPVSLPHQPPAPAAADAARAMPAQPPSRPPTMDEAQVVRLVDAYMKANPAKARKAAKEPKGPKPEGGPSLWKRTPMGAKAVGLLLSGVLGTTLIIRACGPAVPDPQAWANQAAIVGANTGHAAARDEIDAAAQRRAMVYTPEPFANLCVCELSEMAKAAISYSDPTAKQLNADRAGPVAAQVKQLQGTGLYTINDYYLTSADATRDLTVVGVQRGATPPPGAVQLFKPPAATTPTVAGG